MLKIPKDENSFLGGGGLGETFLDAIGLFLGETSVFLSFLGSTGSHIKFQHYYQYVT